MEYKDYYKIMGVSRDATQDQIKRAYRKLARKFHPDVSSEPDAEEKFKEIGEAYEVLKDPQKRAAYDQLGERWKHGEGFQPPPGWDAGFEFGSGGFTGGDATGFSDFFEFLFGGGRDWTRGFGFDTRPRPRPRDHYARVYIDLEDAYSGGIQTITLKQADVDSSGRMITRTLNVKIPKGIKEGQRIRLAGQGRDHGDLYLEVRFKPHRLFRAEGRDIYLKLPITPWEAALGGQVTIPTLGGKVDMKIPPKAQGGQKMRLKGRGLPGNPPGDQYVELNVVVPAADTAEAKALYRKMAEIMPTDPRADLEV